jgi:ferric-dicitrate binding protein FerR (iron transport regulator)
MDESRLYRFLTGELDEAECKEFYDWVKESDSNRKVFSGLKNIWVFARRKGQLSDADLRQEYQRFIARRATHESQMDVDSRTVSRKHTFGYYLLRIAAAVLFLYGTGITYLHMQQRENEEYYEIQTRRGEKSQLLLSDGTKIWINSDSHLRYPTRMTKRNVVVYLDGEAYFEVSKVKGRKFVVHASDLDITALGTSFNVKSYRDEGTVETTLEEGKILIAGDGHRETMQKPIILLPNQRVTIYTEPEKIRGPVITETYPTAYGEMAAVDTPIEPISQKGVLIQHQTNTAIYTSWKDGNLQFRKERFEDLAILLERWYDVKISINDAEIKEWRYTGTFDKETIEQALTALSLSMPFRYTIHKNTVIIEK